MAFEENDSLAEQSASKLRIKLISEIQEFIRSLELKLPLDELTRKRERIRNLLHVLSIKENVEFSQLAGKYFHNFLVRD